MPRQDAQSPDFGVSLMPGVKLPFENQVFIDEFFCRIQPLGISDLRTRMETPFLNALDDLVEIANTDAQSILRSSAKEAPEVRSEVVLEVSSTRAHQVALPFLLRMATP
jgi:hypothetical protein